MTSPYRQPAPQEKPKPEPKNDHQLRCPNCGGLDWLAGPSGGCCQNIMCAACRKRYNHTPWGLERI